MSVARGNPESTIRSEPGDTAMPNNPDSLEVRTRSRMSSNTVGARNPPLPSGSNTSTRPCFSANNRRRAVKNL